LLIELYVQGINQLAYHKIGFGLNSGYRLNFEVFFGGGFAADLFGVSF